jgi:hypothetical protein
MATGAEQLKMLQSLRYMMGKAKEAGQDLGMDEHILSLGLPRVDTRAYSVSLNGLQVSHVVHPVGASSCEFIGVLA